MEISLVELEQQGLKLLNQGKVKPAAEIFRQIVHRQPNYEHGMGFYNLACCLEDLGEFDLAEHIYLRSLQYMPDDLIRLGGYASFLYLHGDKQKALEIHLQLLGLERECGCLREAEETCLVLQTLGKHLGLSETEIAQKINERA